MHKENQNGVFLLFVGYLATQKEAFYN